jgi:hypothetical protein
MYVEDTDDIHCVSLLLKSAQSAVHTCQGGVMKLMSEIWGGTSRLSRLTPAAS